MAKEPMVAAAIHLSERSDWSESHEGLEGLTIPKYQQINVFSKEEKRKHTAHHPDLIMDWNIRPNEPSKLLTDRSTSPPMNERIKNNLIATLSTPKTDD